MTSVVVLGPNGIDQRFGSFHVHAAGCRDLDRYTGREFADDKANPIDVNSVEEIATYVYDFEENPTEYVNDFYILPCVKFTEPIPEKETVMLTAVTFELYNEDMFLEMTIETSNLAETLAMLNSVPNVRNISY